MNVLTVRKSNLGLLAYLASALVLFALVVRPSLEGSSGLRVTADSGTFLALVAALAANPEQLISIGANYLGPFLILRLTQSDHLAVALLNGGLFLLSYLVVVKSFDLHRPRFVALLCLNPMLGISLLSVNKEILAFASAGFMASYLAGGRRWLLAAALSLSILARWQMTLVILIALLVRSRLNPFVRHRALTLALMVGAISVLYPPVLRVHLAAGLESQFTASQFASTAGLTGLFSAIQDNYGYFIVVVPKVLLSYFGNLLRLFDFVVRPDRIDYSDVYNNIVVLGHQVCMAGVCLLALRRRRLTLASDNVFFIAVYSVVFAISVLISYRYFFPIYLLVCIELCRRRQDLEQGSDAASAVARVGGGSGSASASPA
ncbi:MAG: hypothetical protein H0T50_15680 [Gemmatimonadales bacterium]|nr:hypothetical protein [Gemmatimonadales bacterium]